MTYLLFHDNIYRDDGVKVGKIDRTQLDLNAIDRGAICVVDVDVELASAPEGQLEKKDFILARKFAKLHPQNRYILQDERIGDNLFQVIGINVDKIRDIHALIPGEKIGLLVPYGLAIRHFLVQRDIRLVKGIIFIDDLGDQKLLTVYSGLKFSVTRTLMAKTAEDILPEIKRSHIGFNKKIEEFDHWSSTDLTVVTNDETIAHQLTQNENMDIHYINIRNPAFEGLRGIENSERTGQFLLPEEIKNKKRKQEFKEKVTAAFMAFLILGTGLGFLLFNKIKLSLLGREYAQLAQQNQILVARLADLDAKTYRSDLKLQKFLNYAVPYFKILDILPLSYDIDSFKYYPTDHWNLEVLIFSKDGESFDDIPQLSILKNAVINDCFIKDKPGKRIKIEL